MRIIVFFITCMIFAIGSHAQDVNDTQLHNMKPDFKGLPYGIPKKENVKADIDRVITFLEEAMPIEVVDSKLRQGGLRLTSYEAGVLYAAAQDAAKWTGDERYLRFVTDRLTTMAELAPKVRDSLARNKNYDRQMRPVSQSPFTRRCRGDVCRILPFVT